MVIFVSSFFQYSFFVCYFFTFFLPLFFLFCSVFPFHFFFRPDFSISFFFSLFLNKSKYEGYEMTLQINWSASWNGGCIVVPLWQHCGAVKVLPFFWIGQIPEKSLLWMMEDFCLCFLPHCPYFTQTEVVICNLSRNRCFTSIASHF